MNTPAERQASNAAVVHHLAATQHFRNERRHVFGGTWTPLFAAVAAPLVLLFAPTTQANNVVSAVLGALALASAILFQPGARKQHRAGVAELEARDCVVLGLSWRNALADRPSLDTTHRLAGREERHDPTARTEAQRWYEFDDAAPVDTQVLAAQRSNVAWGEDAHARWATLLGMGIVAAATAGIAIAASKELDLGAYLGLVAFPSAPGLIESCRLFVDHREAAEAKRAVRHLIDAQLEGSVQVDLRRNQDEVFRVRLNSPHVPDWWHRATQPAQDTAMRAAARQVQAPGPRTAPPGVHLDD
jgi:hypothetical protein